MAPLTWITHLGNRNFSGPILPNRPAARLSRLVVAHATEAFFMSMWRTAALSTTCASLPCSLVAAPG